MTSALPFAIIQLSEGKKQTTHEREENKNENQLHYGKRGKKQCKRRADAENERVQQQRKPYGLSNQNKQKQEGLKPFLPFIKLNNRRYLKPV